MDTNRLPNLQHKDQETTRRHAIPAWVAYTGSAVWMVLTALVVVYLNAVVSWADPALHGQALVKALRAGGYHIYFRHAATEWSQSDQVVKAGDWTSCEPDKMRQLADRGRHMARAIGEASAPWISLSAACSPVRIVARWRPRGCCVWAM